MKITVTQDDINDGKCGQPEKCAIARAIWRAMESNVPCASVAPEFIDLYARNGEKIGRFTTPEVAERFIIRFDDKMPVVPFSFWLDIGDGAEPFVAPAGISPHMIEAAEIEVFEEAAQAVAGMS